MKFPIYKTSSNFAALAAERPIVKARMRYDWLSTPNGYRGGLNVSAVSSRYGRRYPTFGQRTEFSDFIEGGWDELKAIARKEAEKHFKPIHTHDGEYVCGIVLIEWVENPKTPYRTTLFKNLCAEEFGQMDIATRVARGMGYRVQEQAAPEKIAKIVVDGGGELN